MFYLRHDQNMDIYPPDCLQKQSYVTFILLIPDHSDTSNHR